MLPSSPKPQNPDVEEALLLVSRSLDEPLSESDRSRLEILEARWPEEVKSFRSHARQLRTQLLGLPVAGIPGLLFNANDFLDSKHSAKTVRRSDGPSGVRKFVVVSVSGVVCAMLVMLVFKSAGVDSSAPGVSVELANAPAPMNVDSSTNAQEDMLASSETTSRRSGFSAAPEVTPGTSADSVASLGQELAMADAPMEAQPEDATMASTDDSIQPLIESPHWNVVVVKVDGQDRDQVMDRIQSIVHEHGLQLQRSAGQEDPEWLGVVLTSAGREDVVDAMEKRVSEGTSASNTNSDEPLSSSHAEIVAAVRRSLQYPTLSELHHGRVFVALPTQADLLAKTDRPQVRPSQVPAPNENSVAKSSEAKGGAPGAYAGTPIANEVLEKRKIMEAKSDQTGLKSAEGITNQTEVTLVVFQFGESAELDNTPKPDELKSPADPI